MERCQTFSQDEPIWHQTQRVMILWLPQQPHPPQRESGPVSCATCPERWNPIKWVTHSDVIVIVRNFAVDVLQCFKLTWVHD